MGLSVSIHLTDPPRIDVSGFNIDKLRRNQLSDLLRGEGDLKERIEKRHHGKKIDGFHLSDDDQVPGNLKGTMAKYRWEPAKLTLRAKRGRVLKITSNPVVVGRAHVSNPSSIKDFTPHYEILESVSNSIERVAHWDVSATSVANRILRGRR